MSKYQELTKFIEDVLAVVVHETMHELYLDTSESVKLISITSEAKKAIFEKIGGFDK